jgi:hypothetical protein
VPARGSGYEERSRISDVLSTRAPGHHASDSTKAGRGLLWGAAAQCRTFDGETPTSCPISQTPNLGDGLILGALLGAIIVIPSGLVGGGIGAALGDRTTFTNDPPPSARAPNGLNLS